MDRDAEVNIAEVDITDAAPHPSELTRETLESWRAELSSFFADTRRRLQQLGHAEPATATLQPAASAAICQLASGTESAPPRAAAEGDKPLDRLQAIKLRLASQLENAQRS